MNFAKFFKKEKTKGPLRIVRTWDDGSSPFGTPAALIFIRNETPELCLKKSRNDDGSFSCALTLSNNPLVQYRISREGTGPCRIGPGVSPEERPEFAEALTLLNDGAETMKEKINALSPLLGLLKEGIYAVADIRYFPTDGAGGVFWDVSAELTEHPAFQKLFGERGNALPARPAFLYPSHDLRRFSEELAESEAERIRQGKAPKGIAWYLGNYTSLLLEGHHMALAALAEKRCFDCLTILPLEAFVLPFENETDARKKIIFPEDEEDISALLDCDDDIRGRVAELDFRLTRFPAGDFSAEELTTALSHFPDKKLTLSLACELGAVAWPERYRQGAKSCPTVRETALTLPFSVYDVTTERLKTWLEGSDPADHERLGGALSWLARTNAEIARQTAFEILENYRRYAHTKPYLPAMALETLGLIYGDEEADRFLVRFQLCHGDDPGFREGELSALLAAHWLKMTHLERELRYLEADPPEERPYRENLRPPGAFEPLDDDFSADAP